jgi:hypothetical protein
LIEESNDLRLPIIGISPFQGLIRLISIDQGQIGKNALPEIRAMRISFGGGQDDMFQTEISRVDIDLPVTHRSRIFFFQIVGPLFDLWKQRSRDEGRKCDEPPEEIVSHLLGIIVRKVEGQDVTDEINLSENLLGRLPLLKNVSSEVIGSKEFGRLRFFRFPHFIPLARMSVRSTGASLPQADENSLFLWDPGGRLDDSRTVNPNPRLN